MKLGDVLVAVLVALVLLAVMRWVMRAVTAYPGIGTWDALSIEAGEDLKRWGGKLSKHGRAKLAEEDV